MKRLRHVLKNLSLATLSLLLVIGIFVAGFYIGNSSRDTANERSQVSALTPGDLEPFWKVWGLLDDKFVAASSTATASDTDRVYGAIQGMVDSLGDPYTTFLLPKDHANFQESISGKFQGVGMEVGKRDGEIVVIAPLKNTPAERAGILPGDIILRIDGVSTLDMSVDDAVQHIRGEAGTTVELSLFREDADENPVIVNVERDTITIPTIEYELRDDGIFVISLFSFSGGVEDEFRQALREFVLSDSSKLILDLRGNPGGFLEAAVDVASWFLPSGKVIVREDFDGNREEKVFRSKGYNIFNDNLEMVVLIDEGSASASEIVAGALQEHEIATLVGAPTFGKGSVQELIQITEDTSLKVTIARWLTPNGLSISDGGLTPDVEVVYTREDFDAGVDPQLEKAIDLLR